MKIIVSGLLILCALIYVECKQDIAQDETIQLENIQTVNNPTISNNNDNDDDENDDDENDDDNNDNNEDDNDDDNDDENDEDYGEKIIDKIMEDSRKKSSRRRRTPKKKSSRSRRSRSKSSSTFKSSCLKDANKYRKWHPGTGSLRWSSGLAVAAKRWANFMLEIKTMRHDNKRGNNVGENLWGGGNALGTGIKLLSDVAYCRKANTYWYNEIKDYSYTYPKFSMATGHFTQMVWKGSKKVGYGVAKSKGRNKLYVYVAARYSPSGNYPGRFRKNVLRQNKGKDGEVENFTLDVLEEILEEMLEEEIVEDEDIIN